MSDTFTNLIVDQYKTIAGITRHMLELAQTARWDEVVEQSKQYRHAVEQLKTLEDLSSIDKQARRQLLTQILADDAQIRHLATPELGRLGALLGNMKRQQTVLQAYYSPSVHP
ncbi:MAG: flagellar protein FliT [Alcaligenes nematophilus]|uniref:flagellar protein FliT n=1 Tax=Alcaligenes nematophilus TaxID=2994643 RepID=UPI003CFFF15A